MRISSIDPALEQNRKFHILASKKEKINNNSSNRYSKLNETLITLLVSILKFSTKVNINGPTSNILELYLPNVILLQSVKL